jgi:hypothetical protein
MTAGKGFEIKERNLSKTSSQNYDHFKNCLIPRFMILRNLRRLKRRKKGNRRSHLPVKAQNLHKKAHRSNSQKAIKEKMVITLITHDELQ